MSADLQWMIVRNTSSFLIKRNHTSFSREANNLKNRNSQRYNGVINTKTIGVEPCSDGKGVVLVTRKKGFKSKPVKMYNRVEMKRDSRRTLTSIRKILRNGRYRKDLKMAAVRRASAVLQSQKPVVVRRARTGKKKE